MENFNMEQPSNLLELGIDQQANSFLYETARWGRFISIVGFIMCAIIAVVALFAGSIIGAVAGASMEAGGSEAFAGMGALASMGGVFITTIYLLMVLLYFFPCLYIYNFSSKMKKALLTQDQLLLNTSFKNLKSCFRFIGIFTIIVLGLYALIVVFALIGGLMSF